MVQCFLHSNRSASFSIFLSQVLKRLQTRGPCRIVNFPDEALTARVSIFAPLIKGYALLSQRDAESVFLNFKRWTSPYFDDSEPRHCKQVRRGIANFSLRGRCFMSYGCAGYKQRKLTNLSGPIVVGRGASLPKRIAHSQDGAAKLETTKNPRIVD